MMAIINVLLVLIVPRVPLSLCLCVCLISETHAHTHTRMYTHCDSLSLSHFPLLINSLRPPLISILASRISCLSVSHSSSGLASSLSLSSCVRLFPTRAAHAFISKNQMCLVSLSLFHKRAWLPSYSHTLLHERQTACFALLPLLLSLCHPCFPLSLSSRVRCSLVARCLSVSRLRFLFVLHLLSLSAYPPHHHQDSLVDAIYTSLSRTPTVLRRDNLAFDESSRVQRRHE